MKRTHLPLNALRVYDAAARHLSFTRAADELAVTPAAVGQQIRALEDHLGTVLFRRTSKGLELTQEGAAGLDALREGFLKFEESVSAMQAGQASDSYTIACPREFYAQWLAPRLATFGEANPDIRFTFVADENADFTEANLDCAIRLVDGPGDLQGIELDEARRVQAPIPFVTLNSPVTVVDTTGIKPVAIDDNGVYHYADAIIVTVSLGVLKAGIIDFIPDLPASKLDAIDSIGMGNGLKISLRFGSQIWATKMMNVLVDGPAGNCWTPNKYQPDANDPDNQL